MVKHDKFKHEYPVFLFFDRTIINVIFRKGICQNDLLYHLMTLKIPSNNQNMNFAGKTEDKKKEEYLCKRNANLLL